MNRRLKAAVLLIAALGCATTPQAVAEHRHHPRVEIPTGPFGPMGVTDTPHRTIPVEIAGKKRTALLDSGGGVTIISPKIAAELGCQPHGRLTAHRMTGEKVDMPICDDVKLVIGGRNITVPVAGVFDLSAFMPKDFTPLDGLVSLQTFEQVPVTFDMPNRVLVLENDESLAQRVAQSTPMEIRLSRPAAGVALDVFVSARAATGGEKVWLIIDTGNDAPLILAPHAAKALGIDASKPAASLVLNVSGLGTQTLPATQRELIYDGNIGVPGLKGHVLTFDLERGRAWAASAPAAMR